MAGSIASQGLCLLGDCRSQWPLSGITAENDNLQSVTDRGNATSQALTTRGLVSKSLHLSANGSVTTAKIQSQAAARLDLQNTGPSGREYILDSNSAGNLTITDLAAAQDRLTLTSGGNVGIGTTAPVGRLHLAAGDLRVDGGNVSIQPSGDFGIGNMALGTSVNPNIRLLVSGQAASALSDPDRGFVKFTSQDIARRVINSNDAIAANGGNPAGIRLKHGEVMKWDFFSDNSPSSSFIFNSAQAPNVLRLEQDGRVGISAFNPSARLDVGSPVIWTSSASKVFIAAGSADGEMQVASFINSLPSSPGSLNETTRIDLTWNDGGGVAAAQGTRIVAGKEGDYSSASQAHSYLSFHAAQNNNVTEKLRITSSGNVGIGTSQPSQKLDVAGFIKGQSGLCIAGDCRSSRVKHSKNLTEDQMNSFAVFEFH